MTLQLLEVFLVVMVLKLICKNIYKNVWLKLSPNFMIAMHLTLIIAGVLFVVMTVLQDTPFQVKGLPQRYWQPSGGVIKTNLLL